MIYLDHAAATQLDPEVYEKMLPYLLVDFSNPSSLYKSARDSRSAVDESRETVAEILHCKSSEIFFTSGGTESNNWVVFGVAAAYEKKHFITTSIEHHSILHPMEELKRRGNQVTFLTVDQFGLISLENLEKSLTPETKFVSIMYANNEIGTVENIEKIGEMLRSKNILFHTDACQAAGSLNMSVQDLKVDFMTLNGGKIYGPKGVGVLYIKEGINITPLLYGGGQEHRLRAGTENVAGIVGMAQALKKSENLKEKENARLTILRDKLLGELLKAFPNLNLNGHPQKRLPNNLNISFPGVDGESLLLNLDMKGICVSSGSACTAGSLEPSHVLLGIGLSKELAKGSLRITLGRENTETEILEAARILIKAVKKLSV